MNLDFLWIFFMSRFYVSSLKYTDGH